MDFLGIGMPELIFIVLLALIFIGPKDMEKTGRAIGRFLNNFVHSDGWQAFRQTSKEVRNLPNRLMREANLEDIDKLVKDPLNQPGTPSSGKPKTTGQGGYGTWNNPGAQPSRIRPEPAETENSIAPPKTEPDSTPSDHQNE
jgi:Sec-independent protein translocase protein TatA